MKGHDGRHLQLSIQQSSMPIWYFWVMIWRLDRLDMQQLFDVWTRSKHGRNSWQTQQMGYLFHQTSTEAIVSLASWVNRNTIKSLQHEPAASRLQSPGGPAGVGPTHSWVYCLDGAGPVSAATMPLSHPLKGQVGMYTRLGANSGTDTLRFALARSGARDEFSASHDQSNRPTLVASTCLLWPSSTPSPREGDPNTDQVPRPFTAGFLTAAIKVFAHTRQLSP
jgi:hypothetical protein